MLVVIAVCVLSLRSAVAMLLYIPLLVILAPLTLYYLTWQIRFEDAEIIKSVYFRETKLNRLSICKIHTDSNIAF